MSSPVQQIVEQAMTEKHGAPSCDRCIHQADCLIAFMGPSVNIRPSYVAAPGCGRFEPKEFVEGER